MAVGKGSILRASNAVKEKASKGNAKDAEQSILDINLEKEKTASLSQSNARLEIEKTQEVFWIPIVELRTEATSGMTRQQERVLKASLSKHGFLTPILVWKKRSDTEEELIVLDGIKRIEIAKKIDMKEAPVLISHAKTAIQAKEIRQELHALYGRFTVNAPYEIEQGITSQLPVYLL